MLFKISTVSEIFLLCLVCFEFICILSFIYLVCLCMLVCANSIAPYVANPTTFSYKSKIDGTMRADSFKLAPVSELLSAAATCCGKRISVSRRTK